MIMPEKVRWGIIGTGGIARKFAAGLKTTPAAELVAVGSRSQENADKFGREFGVPRRYGSYERLAADSDVDVVYVAVPHSFHQETSLLCLKADKAVLCEKPFTINAAEAAKVIRLARKKKIFLMEAMWTRFFPLTKKLRIMLAEGVIGEVQMLEADFGYRLGDWNPNERRLDPNLGGGSLLDIGVYCVSLAFMIFGKPVKTKGLACLGKTGVDEQAAWVFQYRNGELAICSSSIRTATPMEAKISGTKGQIRIHSPLFAPTRMTVISADGIPQEMDFPLEGNGMNYEAEAVMKCLREGKLEDETMPLEETLDIMRAMDELRKEWGLKYPME